MYIICIKDLISISGAKFHPMILIVKFHMQFEKKTIAPNPSTYIYYLHKRYEINKKCQVASHYLDS